MGFGCLLCLGLALAVEQNPAPPASAPPLLEQARQLVAEQRYADALKTLERCLERDGRNPEAYKLIAISAIRLDRLDIAEPALRSAAQLAPNDYVVQFHLGALHYTRSEFLLSRPELERAVQLKPDYMPARLFLGLTLEEVGDPKSAIEAYQRAIALAVEQKTAADTAYLYLGRYLYRLDRVRESLPLLQKATQINPASAGAFLALGRTLRALGRDGEAVAALQRSVSADPRDPEPHYYLFRIYSTAHREADAKTELALFRQLKRKPGSDPRRRVVQRADGQE